MIAVISAIYIGNMEAAYYSEGQIRDFFSLKDVKSLFPAYNVMSFLGTVNVPEARSGS